MHASSMSKVTGVLVAAFLWILFPASDVKACEICAGRGCSVFCQQVAIGSVECDAFACDCIAAGICGWTLTGLNGEEFASTCATTESNKEPGLQQSAITAQRGLKNLSRANMDDGMILMASRVLEYSQPRETSTIDEPSPLEIEALENLKERSKSKLNNISIDGDPIDYITLIQSESRDEAWAPRAEISVSQALSSLLDLEESGLSQPVVRCATNVCEIMIVQNTSDAEKIHTNWQTQFIELTNSNALGMIVADIAILMTHVGDDKTGFVSYILIDRGAPDEGVDSGLRSL